MRFTRKLMLVAVTAIAAMAFMAANASATDMVQVVSATPAVCTTAGTSSGGCPVHAVGTMSLRVDIGIFGEASEMTCNLEVEMRLSGNGTGKVDALEHSTGPDANCATVLTECALPWSTDGEEDGTAGVVQSNASICIDPAEADVCQGNLAFNLVEQAGEHYETQFNNASVGLCELDVDLEIEASSNIHINHP
jgi:hypothetical protein